ncbi:MAG: hypothetical protein NTY53_14920, partial [Kiritimatiellaeota bacterium]|nr:hypothetical protein [Kiritimatiellota bacterium]
MKTDALKIGDPASEKAHRYESPQASEPYEIVSRYEWGVDTIPAVAKATSGGKALVIYPPHADQGRKTRGASEFSLDLKAENFGVVLRRKLDYAFPNQRADIFIADESNGKTGAFKSAGVWYLAGSNTCLFSSPGQELGAAQQIVQTSNRRFRDDEFLLPLALTQGRETIRIRIEFTPVSIPL